MSEITKNLPLDLNLIRIIKLLKVCDLSISKHAQKKIFFDN